MKKIYLDYAAATPLDSKVFEAMKPYLSDKFYNPSALYLDAKNVAKDIWAARQRIAGHLGARPGEIIFTAGGTEANNLAVRGVMEAYPGTNVIVSSIEHNAILNPAHAYDCQELPVDEKGIVKLDQLEKIIDEKTVLVSVIYANNEVGTIQPLSRIAKLITTIRRQRQEKGNQLPLYFHTDACQAAAYLDLHASRLGVDMMTINAGKIYGPKQCGALFVRAGTKLKPQILGGGQEQNYRSGTENVAAIIGFAQALDIVQQRRNEESKRLQDLQVRFIDLLIKKIPTVVINGSLKQRLPNNVHITILGQDNERLVMALDEGGILCAAGSACSASNDEPSHVLMALGLSVQEAQSSLRFTMGRDTTETSIRVCVDTLAKLVA